MIDITTKHWQFLRGSGQSAGRARISDDDPLRATIITAHAKRQINTRPGKRRRENNIVANRMKKTFFRSTDLFLLRSQPTVKTGRSFELQFIATDTPMVSNDDQRLDKSRQRSATIG
ncbi:hypothetical protein M514_06658 [Trichuris suis]|uniref:Uncharacterized protein n=1 Tax=Trichuris suis TaxID=68888 RepID=A0A085NHQ9_9BILA|nr:hypothetical protein M513_06658 [Trichuris suis]KFD69005.1 hypothetical protein M514_06658 [Trichuris suis]